MVKIPEKKAENIEKIIEWHLKTYMSDKLFNICLTRVLDCCKTPKNGMAWIDTKYLKHIEDCGYDATNNTPECGVEEETVRELYDWIVELRKS